jgi:hypothetical protein
MKTTKTYFEQIPIAIVKKIAKVRTLDGNESAHVVQFYTRDEFLIDGLCRYVRAAIMQGESAVLVVSQSHHRELTDRLHRCGDDVSVALKEGRCVLLDADELLAKFTEHGDLNQGKFVSVVGSLIERARLKSGGKRVAVFGEMVAVLWAEKKYDAALRLEEFWNDLMKSHSFYLRCAYPASSFEDEHGDHYSAVCGAHSEVIREACA